MEGENNITISIVIPVYQFNEELAELSRAMFESLMETDTREKLEIIVVDNASTVDVATLKNYATKYIRNETNLGYCKAVNQGFKEAIGDLIAVVNNDIKISSNWVHISSEIFKENKRIGSVHFKMIGYNDPVVLGNDVWIGGKERWCHASFYVIKKEAIPEGAYFEGYKEGGYDDYDFFHRMRDVNGLKQAYTNKVVFNHRDSSTYMALDKRDGNRAERDLKNREIYKERFGEYPDVQFANLFPEQMKQPWKPFP